MNQGDLTSDRTLLTAVQKQFKQWRTTRTKRTTIPEHLWQAAVDLSPHYSLTQISRSLSVDYRLLKERVHASGCGGTTHSIEGEGYTFVELGMREEESSREYIIELEDTEGSRMRVQMNGEVDVDELIKAFWNRRR